MELEKFAEIWCLAWSLLLVVSGALLAAGGYSDLAQYAILTGMFLVLLANYLNGVRRKR